MIPIDEDIAALVVDNGTGMSEGGYPGQGLYARVGSDGIVQEISNVKRPPFESWKNVKSNTAVGKPYDNPSR